MANAFDVSISAAARVGPKIGRPAARNRSTIPASSGASGPTMVRSTGALAGEALEGARGRATLSGDALPELGDARIPGRGDQLEVGLFAGELPRERVLAPAAADEENAHGGGI